MTIGSVFRVTHHRVLQLWLGCLCVSVGLEAAAPAFDPDRLRGLLKSPGIQLESGYQVSGRGDVSTHGETIGDFGLVSLPDRIAALRERGDAGSADPGVWLDLMQFYERVKDRPNYDHAREQARIRLSREIESQPGNGWLRSRLGRLSEALGEAEALLRAGVSISPDDWRCWMELGDFLAKRALDHALWLRQRAEADGADRPVPAVPADFDLQGCLAEGRRCYDKAVSIGDGVPEAYAARVGFGSLVLMVQNLGALPGQPNQVMESLQGFSPEMISDLKAAAARTDENPILIGAAAMSQVLVEVMRLDSDPLAGGSTLGFMGVLPSHIRSYVTDTLGRLETMAERADPAVATAALTAMGELQGVVLGDYRMAEETLKRAIARNPLPDAPWESLVVLHAASEQPGKIADLLSLRLKTRDTARNHLLLAKAHEQLDHSDDAERQFMALLKHEPENPVAAIGLASVRLKRARDEASLRSVGQYLSELESGLMKKVPPDMVLGFEFVHGIYFALDGNLGEARSHIRRLLAADPFNKDYQAANDALGR